MDKKRQPSSISVFLPASKNVEASGPSAVADNRSIPVARSTFALLWVSVFAVSLAYGIVLPVLPFFLERLLAAQAGTSVSWYAGTLTGLYMLALFAFAPVWGRLSDRMGRRRVISLGLAGLVGALVLFGLSGTLWLLYLAQAVAGAFAAAVLPVTSAYVADMSTDGGRARRFAHLSTGYGLGFLGGPALGGWLAGMEMAMPLAEAVKGGRYALPFFAAAGIGGLAWLGIHFLLPDPMAVSGQRMANVMASRKERSLVMLLLTLLVMFGLGVFEVSLTLQGQQNLGLAPREIALMFTECSVVMLAAQAVVFSPLLKDLSKRHLVFLGFMAMAAGLVVLPHISALRGLMVFVGLVAAGAGILLPTLTYLVSLNAGQAHKARRWVSRLPHPAWVRGGDGHGPRSIWSREET